MRRKEVRREKEGKEEIQTEGPQILNPGQLADPPV